MKIRAVRLREVGCFSKPVAVEGFSGALDVLAGPNELGKSTILRALQALFTHKHTAKSAAVEQLRSYAGGAPLVEVDFEASGGLWRLRKQYLSEPQALVTDLATGRVAARGEKAHELALQLCDGNAAGLFGLLWVGQTQSLEVPVPEKESRATLEIALDQEISALAGGSGARLIRAKAAATLQDLVTKAVQRPRGAYRAALDERARVEDELAQARKAAAEAAERLDQLARILTKRAALLDPAVAQTRQRWIADLQQRLEAALNAQRQLRAAEGELRAATSVEANARRACELLERDLAEVAQLLAAEEAGVAALEAERLQLAGAEAYLGAARAERDRYRSLLGAARARMQAREDADRSAQAARGVADIEARLTQGRAAVARVAELEAQLSVDPATAELFGAADREARAVSVQEARVEAACPKVRISYAPQPRSRLRIGGRVLGDGEVLSPAGPVTIEIEGVGTIEIDPAVSEDTASDRADLQVHRETLAGLLVRMGASTVEQARDAYDRRHALENELRRSQERFAMLAPRGLASLAAEKDALSKVVRPPSATKLPDRVDIDSEIARLVREEAGAEVRSEELAAAVANVRESVARLSSDADARRNRIAELEGRLPPPAVCTAHLSDARSKAALAKETLNAAVRSHAAWIDKALSDAALDALKAGVAKAGRDEEAREHELIELNQKLAVLAGLLERDHQDDLIAKADELEGQLAAATARIRECEREVAALQLLIDKLDEVERRSRATFVRPIISRLEPLLDIVLPGARVEIDRDLRVSRVERAGQREAVQALSQGTREQISVLARLAFGALLADSGRPAPLILDDALVYSDDTRIGVLLEMLRRAANAHQIIVLTCRTRTFEDVRATHLRIQPWSRSDPGAEVRDYSPALVVQS